MNFVWKYNFQTVVQQTDKKNERGAAIRLIIIYDQNYNGNKKKRLRGLNDILIYISNQRKNTFIIIYMKRKPSD